MQRSNLKFITLIILLSIFQLIINNSTTLYIDCLSVILVALLFRKHLPLQVIIFLSLFADLMGHWYLGSHLFAAILLSFITQKMVIFYSLSGKVQRCVIVSLFYALMSLILSGIGLLTHNSFIKWLDLSLEIFILCPVILSLYSLTQVRGSSSNIIF